MSAGYRNTEQRTQLTSVLLTSSKTALRHPFPLCLATRVWSMIGSLPVLGCSLGNIMLFFFLFFFYFSFVVVLFVLPWDFPCVHPHHHMPQKPGSEMNDFIRTRRDRAEQSGKRAKPYRYYIKSRKPLWWRTGEEKSMKARLEEHISAHSRPGAIRVPHLFNCWRRCSLSARSLLLVSSTASRVSFSLLFSSWSFWLLYCRSATQAIKSEVSLSQ